MTKEIKQCCVRLPQDLHAWAKSYAYGKGMTLQEYISCLLEEEKSAGAALKKEPLITLPG